MPRTLLTRARRRSRHRPIHLAACPRDRGLAGGESDLGLGIPGPVPLGVLDMERVVDDIDRVYQGSADLEDRVPDTVTRGRAHAKAGCRLVAILVALHQPGPVERRNHTGGWALKNNTASRNGRSDPRPGRRDPPIRKSAHEPMRAGTTPAVLQLGGPWPACVDLPRGRRGSAP